MAWASFNNAVIYTLTQGLFLYRAVNGSTNYISIEGSSDITPYPKSFSLVKNVNKNDNIFFVTTGTGATLASGYPHGIYVSYLFIPTL